MKPFLTLLFAALIATAAVESPSSVRKREQAADLQARLELQRQRYVLLGTVIGTEQAELFFGAKALAMEDAKRIVQRWGSEP